MNQIEFRNTRFDPDLVEFHGIAKEMARSVGYTAELSIDKPLAQLLRLRVAQRNECSYCVILHARTAREIGIPQAKVDNISSWWQSDLYTEAESVALDYADILSVGSTKDFQRYHDALTAHFSEKEIAEIAAVVINMNLWTRLKLAQGATPFVQE